MYIDANTCMHSTFLALYSSVWPQIQVLVPYTQYRYRTVGSTQSRADKFLFVVGIVAFNPIITEIFATIFIV